MCSILQLPYQTNTSCECLKLFKFAIRTWFLDIFSIPWQFVHNKALNQGSANESTLLAIRKNLLIRLFFKVDYHFQSPLLIGFRDIKIHGKKTNRSILDENTHLKDEYFEANSYFYASARARPCLICLNRKCQGSTPIRYTPYSPIFALNVII